MALLLYKDFMAMGKTSYIWALLLLLTRMSWAMEIERRVHGKVV